MVTVVLAVPTVVVTVLVTSVVVPRPRFTVVPSMALTLSHLEIGGGRLRLHDLGLRWRRRPHAPRRHRPRRDHPQRAHTHRTRQPRPRRHFAPSSYSLTPRGRVLHGRQRDVDDVDTP